MTFKYNLAADFMREKLYSGQIKPGDKLPSVQALSKQLSVNADTIIKAYKLLETEHLIYAAPKSGYYAVKAYAAPPKLNSLMDMRTACPADDINPYKDFYHCMEKAISLYRAALFDYAPPQGMPELVQILAKHMTNYRIFTEPQDIFITNGAQQALYILMVMPFPNNNSTILVEQPTYSFMLETAKNCNIPVVGITRTAHGIDLNELEMLFKEGNIKFFYTMPRFQNPTGFSYTKAQRQDIVRLAKQYKVYIVEDDYLADLEIDPKSDPLYSIGAQEQVIYIHSFSKSLLPGLRLGMAIVPDILQNQFMAYKRSIDLNTPILTQGALEIYLRSSMYTIHAKRIKQHYKEKMAILQNLYKQINHQLDWLIPPSGIYTYIETAGTAVDKLVKRLEKQGLLLTSTNNCYIPHFMHQGGVRLCICKVSAEDLPKAIKLLLDEMLNN